MPHIVIEYSNNIKRDIQKSDIAKIAHEITVNSGLFSPEAVKSRSISYDDYTLPEGSNNFMHITISILTGRNIDIRKAFCDSIFAAAKKALPNIDKLSVNIHEMEEDSYNK